MAAAVHVKVSQIVVLYCAGPITTPNTMGSAPTLVTSVVLAILETHTMLAIVSLLTYTCIMSAYIYIRTVIKL